MPAGRPPELGVAGAARLARSTRGKLVEYVQQIITIIGVGYG